MQVAVRLNNQPWWTATDFGDFNLRTTVTAGDTVDFTVYGAYFSGQTPVSAFVSYVSKFLQIETHPSSQTSYLGKSVSFSVSATNGVPPYGYQWQKDGVQIPGATYSLLVLTNLQATNAGVYTVVVSDTVTNLTSQPATLTINPSGVSIALYAGVTIDGVVGQTYGVQSTLDLSNTNSWVGRTNITLTTPTYLWYDSQPATQPQTYYRVLPGPISIP